MNAAERYDWECEHVLGRRTQDLEWYVSWASRVGGSVLELACGTGRIARPLAAVTGLPVVALDIDLDMVRAAGLAGAVVADMRRLAFRPGLTFGLVILAYNSLQLLDADGRRACLSAAGEVGTTLAIECTDFLDGIADRAVGPELLAEHDGVALYGAVEHDSSRRVSTYRRRFVLAGGDEVTDVFTIASLDGRELEELLGQTGWRVVELVQAGPVTRCVARVG